MVVVGALVLLLWLPLRQRPGIGTVVYALTIGPLVHPLLPLLAVDRRAARGAGWR